MEGKQSKQEGIFSILLQTCFIKFLATFFEIIM